MEIKKLKKFCKKVITVPRKKQWSLGNIVRTGLSFSPFLITGHTSKLMREEIKSAISESQFDLIHVETSYVMQNLPAGNLSIPVVLVEHNIEYLVYKRFADNAPLILRPLLYLDVAKLKYWEERMWKKATKLVAVSNIEKKIMSKIRKDVIIVPNGVDIAKFNSAIQNQSSRFKVHQGEKRILFIGEFKWVQNINAIEWILKEIWPKLRAEFTRQINNREIKLWVVGRDIPSSIRKLTNDKSVFFDENAPLETELIYQNAYLLLAPIKVGGGTSFKILEGMASGVPVITTPLGNAIGAKEDSEILIANDSEGFVGKTLELLENDELYEEISKNARKFIEENYDWGVITKKLESVYESAAS